MTRRLAPKKIASNAKKRSKKTARRKATRRARSALRREASKKSTAKRNVRKKATKTRRAAKKRERRALSRAHKTGRERLRERTRRAVKAYDKTAGRAKRTARRQAKAGDRIQAQSARTFGRGLGERSGDVTDRDLGYREFVRQFADMSVGEDLVIGLLDGVSPEVITYGASNEYGTRHVPARPFLGMTLGRRQAVYLRAITQAVRKGEDLGDALERLGPSIVADVKRQRGFRRNKPSTVAEKGTSTPLVDSGVMFEALAYDIRPRGRQ